MRTKQFIVLLLLAAVVISGCNIWHLVTRDMPIEDMDELREKYEGRTAWTKSYIVDTGQNGVIEQDKKLKIVELDLHWQGALGVRGPDGRKYRHALNLERPLTREKYEEAIHELLWFESPEKRYRENLWKYGKEISKAILNHELIEGMSQQAARESWGPPAEKDSVNISGSLQIQWKYVDPRNVKEKPYIVFVNGKVTEWSE